MTWRSVVEAAAVVRLRLHGRGLQSWVKTTGGKGLHVAVPLRPGCKWEDAKAFSRGLVEEIARQWPDRYTTDVRKDRRHGRVYLDYLRNVRAGTAVAAYSLRAVPGAAVSVPIGWDEVSVEHPVNLALPDVLRRLAQGLSDPWQEYWDVRQALPSAARRRAPSTR